jgi:hypothetical protein
MKIVRNKTTATVIATVLLLTIAVTLVALPAANAHTPAWIVPTWSYVSATPDVVGVNQAVIIVFWCNFIPPTAYGNYGDRWTFYVNVTAPDGKNETLGPFISDPVGGSYTLYTPTQVGTYTAQAWFIGKKVDNTPNGPSPTGGFMGSDVNLNDTYQASTSEPSDFTVQQEPLPYYVETPLPSGYWTRPVYGANRDWWSVMGQWLGGPTNPGRINDYTQGPESSHILWARPVWLGGVMGGQVGESSIQREYYTGQSYEGYGGPSLIVDGKIFYSVGQPPAYGWYCVDLYTGKTVYYENNTDGRHAMPSMGQILNIDNPNQHGGFAYLWRTSGVQLEQNPGGVNGTVWEMFDAYTGNMICRVANVSTTGTQFMDTIGSICYLRIYNAGTTAAPDYHMTVWNSTQAIYAGTTSSFGVVYWSWRPTGSGTHAGRTYGTGFNGNNGFTMNASCPAVQGSIRQIVYNLNDKYVIGGTTGNITTNPGQNTKGNLWCLSLDPKDAGRLIWNFTFTPPAGLGDAARQSGLFTGHDTASSFLNAAAGVFAYQNSMLRLWWIYSLDQAKTGQPQGTLLWTSPPEDQFNFYGLSGSVYRGRLYTYGMGGILLAYNITTGHIDWNWSAPYVGVDETPYRHTPLSLAFIANGKIYLYSGEHSPTMPLRRDGKIYCVDTETGQMLWAITCWPSSSPIISDGRIIAYDLQDGMIYCYGKGNSATTVAASPEISVHGNSVMIKGTVTDETDTGRLNTNAAGTSHFNSLNVPVSGDYDFTLKGTPAIADESMDAWMEYQYHQRPIPTDAKGVEVSLDTIDPNGNFVHIGTVTSDLTGAYGYKWMPEVPGTYQIIATFAGSKSYGASSAQTYVGVDEAPPATAPPEYPQPIDNTMTIVYATIAIIIAIIVSIAIATILIRRK